MKLQLAGIGYKQGGRQMVVTAMNPIALVKTVAEPDQWNPVGSQPHGNRPQNKQHRKGIADYLETVEHFVLSAVVLYAKQSEARFVPDRDWNEDEERAPGILYLDYGANFDVGDGQHRIGAYSDVMRAHIEDGDPVRERLHASGQPVVVVIDDNPLNRAQDFTDLQRNAKLPPASIGLSMDRRQPVNRLLISLVQEPRLKIFGDDGSASRVEFLKDSPGKLSAKLFSFKTVRYTSGTALIGVSQRSSASWDKWVNSYVEEDLHSAREDLIALWAGLANLRPYAEVINASRSAAQLRSDTYLASAGVLYAIAYAIYMARHDHKLPITHAVEALTAIDFKRPRTVGGELKTSGLTPEDSLFVGNLVDPTSGKIAAGRAAWEAAGEAIRARIVKPG
ncbi:DNA sulfur modification protein DndB [Streptomyces sp. NPDC018000]|uniref:DNA sulfur modification protein DndB n=1 Tax=Streptomyces sp. NPDC018000 TaxID=3365028 RepID=UPI0037A2AF4D